MATLSSEETRQLTNAAILKQLAEGVIVTDAVGTITFVNDAAAEIHGVARLDVKPNAYSKTYHLYREDGRSYPSDELPLARAVRGETVTDARWRIRRPDGREVLAIGTAQPLRASDGRRIGAVLTLRDATAHDMAERSLQKSESALRDAHRELAQHRPDAGRTRPIAEPRLPGSPEATRDLRAPIKDIVSYARRLTETTSIENARLYGERLQATASALLALVDSLGDPSVSGDDVRTEEPIAGRPKLVRAIR